MAYQLILSFNSKLVRLKVRKDDKSNEVLITLFQFQIGAIKSQSQIFSQGFCC